MTTNQTINGVPRELLDAAVVCMECADYLPPQWAKELRALLDAPAKDYVMINNMYFSHAEILKWREKACMELEAVQSKGEPVAWVVFDNGFIDDHTVVKTVADEWAELGLEVTPLYAEQPAPVAMCDCNQGRFPCNGRCKP